MTVAEAIAARLEGVPDCLALSDRCLDAPSLARVYAPRAHRPFWSDAGALRLQVFELLAAVTDAPTHGLDADSYPLAAIEERLRDASPDARAELDLLLTATLGAYVSHVGFGRSDPAREGEALLVRRRKPDAAALLSEAFGERGLSAVLSDAPPPHDEYERLRRALARYRKAERAGNWPTLPAGPTLESGAGGPALQTLCLRLKRGGELAGPCDGDRRYDAEIEAAVRRFQRGHGLEPDGRVGGRTRAELNRPPSHWARRIALNLERWRWLPRDLGPRFLFVNLPGFELRLVERGSTAMRLRVIIGTVDRATPWMHSRIPSLVINPAWRVPASIADEQLRPKILADADFLARESYDVLPPGRVSEPMSAEALRSIDWKRVDLERFELRLRQRPGPRNALGRLRFDLQNDEAIYLHDTPARHLFGRRIRALSWGCIRVEHARHLASALLGNDTGWSRERLAAEIGAGRTRRVRLDEPIPVYVTYLTARIADPGTQLEFYGDVYDRDALLQAEFLPEFADRWVGP